MPSTPSTRETLASVLVVYANSSVGVEIAQRLFDAAEVSIAPVPEALDGLERGCRHDAVLLCPYLAPAERAALTGAVARRPNAPAVVEVHDRSLPPGAHVRVSHNDSDVDLAPLLAALALPLEA